MAKTDNGMDMFSSIIGVKEKIKETKEVVPTKKEIPVKETKPKEKIEEKSSKNKKETYHVKNNVYAAGFVSEKDENGEELSIRDKIAILQGKNEDASETVGRNRHIAGEKLNRINMTYSDQNYYYLKTEAARRAMSATEFINYIVRTYRESENGYIE